MANTTTEYVDVDGVSLNTFAFNISTWGGDRLAPPSLRGTNLSVPSRAGRLWQPKVADQRVITLAMWVIGTDEDGFRPASGDMAHQFDTNFRKIRNLLWNPRREMVLTKRITVDGVLKTVSAKAQFGGGLNPTMGGRARGVFTVDLVLADPFFYGPVQTTSLVTGTQTVNILGDDWTQNIILTFNGSRSSPKVRNNTLLMDVEYDASLGSGDQTVVDVKNYKSTTTPSGGAATNTTGFIVHSGATEWLSLQPGANSIILSSDSGSGVVSMQYQEAWI